MAKNVVYKPGWKRSVVCTNPAVPISGGAVRLGILTGIALTNERTDGTTSVDFGPFIAKLSVKDELTGGIAVGAALFYKDGVAFLTNDPSGTNHYFGIALEIVGNNLTATIEVLHSVSPGAGTLADDSITEAKIAAGAVTTVKVASAAVTQPKIKTKAVVALADAAATLTATQLVDSGIFTITPTTGRTLTTDTAANIIAAMPGYQVGTWFEFTIVVLAAQTVTLAAGTGVTLIGVVTVNNVSGTWLTRIDSASAITIYRV